MTIGNQTNITPPRVSLIDERTGAVSREWYRWFYSLFTTLGSGTGIIPVDSGGTGLGTIPTNGQLLIGNGSGYTLNTLGAGAGISVTNGLGTITIANTGVLSFSGGTTGLTPATATAGVVTLAGTLIAANGGTGFASYSVGDLLYASTTTTLAKLPDVVTGNALISGGVTTAPAWGKIGLTTHVSGVLPIANGGTNSTSTPTAGAVPYGTGTAYAFTAAGTAGQVLTSAGASVPTWTTPTTGTVTSVGLAMPTQFTVTNSPVTSSGTLTAAWNTQSANVLLAGPTSGAGAVPTFRALTTADIPALPYGSGTVTSVALTLPSIISVSGSPVTTSGTLTGTLTTQAVNRIFAGPSSGAAAAPTFRALTTTDIPSLSYVSSVALALPSIMTVSGSPVTSSGTLTGTLTTQAVNRIFAGPSSGAATAPTFRALVTADIPSLSYVSSVGATAPITTTGGLTPTIGVTAAALAKTDDTNVTMTLSGAPTTALLAATTMALGWTGQLAVSRGGTGAATTTANFVFAGPTSGAPAAPTFRALTTADISSLGYVTSVSGTTGRITSTGGTTPVIDLASGVITAGTTGSITAIPVITVDTYGRVTSITTAANPQGTVTSVTGTSPVVSSGGATPAISLATAYGDTLNPYASKTANTILAAPNGSAGVPTFRSLTTADIPALPYGTGTVTSVALTLPSIISVSGSPVTSSGTLTGTLTTQSVNSIFAGPSSGAAAAPTFRALTTADIPALAYGTGTVTSVSVVSANGLAGTVATATTTPAITLSTSITGVLKGNGTAISAAVANTDYVPLSTVITKTADYTITGTDTWIINNKTGSALTLTFPAASSWTGRYITVKNMQAQAVNSASSNIVPIDSTTAGTAILLGVVGNWATMVSDGTNWIIMQAASNNNLLLE
jgi:hypothetical protein